MRVCKCCCWLQLHNQRSWGNKGFRLELTFGAYFMVPSQYAEMLCKSVRKKKKKRLCRPVMHLKSLIRQRTKAK